MNINLHFFSFYTVECNFFGFFLSYPSSSFQKVSSEPKKNKKSQWPFTAFSILPAPHYMCPKKNKEFSHSTALHSSLKKQITEIMWNAQTCQRTSSPRPISFLCFYFLFLIVSKFHYFFQPMPIIPFPQNSYKSFFLLEKHEVLLKDSKTYSARSLLAGGVVWWRLIYIPSLAFPPFLLFQMPILPCIKSYEKRRKLLFRAFLPSICTFRVQCQSYSFVSWMNERNIFIYKHKKAEWVKRSLCTVTKIENAGEIA